MRTVEIASGAHKDDILDSVRTYYQQAYQDAILDADGTELGKSTSRAVVLGMTPHMWQFHQSTVELDNGSYVSSGLLDVHAMMRGMTQILQVTGVSGDFDGRSGYATIPIGDTSQKPPTYAISYPVY